VPPRQRRGARSAAADRRPPAARRLVALLLVLVTSFAAVAVRLFMLQTVEAPAYARLAVDQRRQVTTFPADRGSILDREGEPLAVSVELRTVFADPGLVEDPAASARRLAPVLGLRPGALEPKLRGTRPGSRFEFLARQVEPRLAEAVEALGVKGVFARPEAKRFYPNARLASHLIGFTNVDGVGTAGVEHSFDGVLEGEPGRMAVEQDPSGRPLPQAGFRLERAEPGRDLYLTIDKDIQYFTELTLAAAARRYHADAASAIVMRPATGEILALANVPDFDPNRLSEGSDAAMRNRAVTDVYEPGSAYKIVTVAAALEERVVTPATRFWVPPAFAYVDRVFNDSHFHEPESMTVTEIIEQSSNVGTIKMGLRLGAHRLIRYVRRFGFGQPTGLDFPGEAPGIVLPLSRWSGSTIATVPIGQGIAATPLQMAAAFATLANDGVWVEPKLLHGSATRGGSVAAPPSPATRRVVSARTAHAVRRLLVGVVERGTGQLARVPGYRVAGKTGTAQKPLPGGGYGNSYVGSFGGFAPAGDPEIVVLVTFDEPDPIWGGSTAAPTFRTIMEFALRRLAVAPSGDAEDAARRLERANAEVPAPHD
jgi:cell division protein FtsI (penicillin-binding protein 3)